MCNSLTEPPVVSTAPEADEASDVVKVKVSVREDYSKAYEVLSLVNQERTAAGLPALTMDQSLLETAMQRATEAALYWSHTRPSGQSCTTANSLLMGENMAYGSTTASEAMGQWMNSRIHKGNILTSGYYSIGVGCVTVGALLFGRSALALL